MKRIFAVGIVLALAAGCSTASTTNNGGGTVAQDTTTTADTGAPGNGDAKAIGDTTSGDVKTTDTKTTDSSTADVKKDTAVAPTKCAPANNTCIGTCVQASCTNESMKCEGDAKCPPIIACLNACDQNALPASTTETTCIGKCAAAAGETAMGEFYDVQTCLGSNCITCKSGDSNCEQACAGQLCIDSLMVCESNASCLLLLDCLNTNKCQDQACLTKCTDKYPDGTTDYMNAAQCYQTNMTACE